MLLETSFQGYVLSYKWLFIKLHGYTVHQQY